MNRRATSEDQFRSAGGEFAAGSQRGAAAFVNVKALEAVRLLIFGGAARARVAVGRPGRGAAN
jgi:hypothetical protein